MRMKTSCQCCNRLYSTTVRPPAVSHSNDVKQYCSLPLLLRLVGLLMLGTTQGSGCDAHDGSIARVLPQAASGAFHADGSMSGGKEVSHDDEGSALPAVPPPLQQERSSVEREHITDGLTKATVQSVEGRTKATERNKPEEEVVTEPQLETREHRAVNPRTKSYDEGQWREGEQPSSASGSEGREEVRVHLVPHTHLDVGWLKTVDQVFMGANNSIQVSAAQYVLDSIVQNLANHPDRKFSFVEQAYFQRWWRQQSRSTRRLVRRLVKGGQLEFINGGWAMHDEATTHFIDMIDQMSLGHQFLLREFGITPRVAWQIDPFGHSAVQAYLITAQGGLDALFFARADYADIAKRRLEKTMEFVWRASPSLGSSADVFTGILTNHYSPPEGFNFDVRNTDPPIQDDPNLEDYNVGERVEAFVQAALKTAEQLRGNDVMFLMGQDFCYSNANMWFKNMDKLIHHVNKDGRVQAFYSTPSLYLDSKHAANITWPSKLHGDFFPYADCPHCYWTGYFSSRPAFKGFVRHASGYLQAARQLQVLTSSWGERGRDMERKQEQKQPEGGRRRKEGSNLRDSRKEGMRSSSSELKRRGSSTITTSSSSNGAFHSSSSSSSSAERSRRQCRWQQGDASFKLAEALALAQHHDAITGTERQHVADDYAKRIAEGMDKAEAFVCEALARLAAESSKRGAKGAGEKRRREMLGDMGGSEGREEDGDKKRGVQGEDPEEKEKEAGESQSMFQFKQCRQLNISLCPATASLKTPQAAVLLAVYNPLGWARNESVRIPVPTPHLRVSTADGTPLTCQVVPLPRSTLNLRERFMSQNLRLNAAADEAIRGADDSKVEPPRFEVIVRLQCPPLGVSFLQIEATEGASKSGGCAVESYVGVDSEQDKDGSEQDGDGSEQDGENGSRTRSGAAGSDEEEQFSIGNDNLQLKFSAKSGALEELKTQSDLGTFSIPLSHSFRYYNSSDGNFWDQFMQPRGPQASGAYIFRPNSSRDFPVTEEGFKPSFEVIRGPLLEEVRQQLAPWISQTIRVFRGEQHAEFEFTVGPIPIAANEAGREVVSCFAPKLESSGVFFSDSNGRDYIKRVRNHRSDWELNVTEPVACNFYPATTGIFLEDSFAHFSVLIDRAQAVSSQRDGEVEMMIHRRMLQDDHRGVGEPLNEQQCFEANSFDADFDVFREEQSSRLGSEGSQGSHSEGFESEAGGGGGGGGEICQGLVVQGTHLIFSGRREEGSELRRALAQRLLSPLILGFAGITKESEPLVSNLKPTSLVSEDFQLPPNVALISLQNLEEGGILLRVAHLFEVNENAEHSKPATLSIDSLFKNREVVNVEERKLFGGEMKARPMIWKSSLDARSKSSLGGIQQGLDGRWILVLHPMEIHTLHITTADP